MIMTVKNKQKIVKKHNRYYAAKIRSSSTYLHLDDVACNVSVPDLNDILRRTC